MTTNYLTNFITKELTLSELIVIRFAINYMLRNAFETFHYARYTIAEAFKRIDLIIEKEIEKINYDISNKFKLYLIMWDRETDLLYELNDTLLTNNSIIVEFYFYELNYIYTALSSYMNGNYFERIKNTDKRKIRRKIITAINNKNIIADNLMRKWIKQ
jgi:hypothetical protein